jgi:hypothetical protein
MPGDSYIPGVNSSGKGKKGPSSDGIDFGPAPKEHQEGRVCKREGCDTRLNRYNPNGHCYTHQREIDNASARNAPQGKKLLKEAV